MKQFIPPSAVVPDRDHSCVVCQQRGAAYWGFHGRFFCAAHRDQGEALMASTQDSVAAPSLPLPPAAQQGRLI